MKLLLLLLVAPASAVRLYLVRHGDPEYINLISGLTDHGREEARALAPYLATLGLTHAYTSPMPRAKLTAQIALQDIPQFAADNFAANVGLEKWCAEKESWQAGQQLAQKLHVGTVIWDLPATMLRTQMADTAAGTSEAVPGWVHSSPDHGEWIEHYKEFCNEADEFLARHGIVRNGTNYGMSEKDAADPSKREAQIVIFGHGGTFLCLLAHLLQIPLPVVHASFWLPPSSVTTILFEEYPQTGSSLLDQAKEELDRLLAKEEKEESKDSDESCDNNSTAIILTPRAIGIGGTSHLALAGMDIALSKYEQGKRPSGLKHNYY